MSQATSAPLVTTAPPTHPPPTPAPQARSAAAHPTLSWPTASAARQVTICLKILSLFRIFRLGFLLLSIEKCFFRININSSDILKYNALNKMSLILFLNKSHLNHMQLLDHLLPVSSVAFKLFDIVLNHWLRRLKRSKFKTIYNIEVSCLIFHHLSSTRLVLCSLRPHRALGPV